MNLRLAILSVHTCPLAPLGGWETGGLNVYVREVSRELAARGVQVDIFTRRQVDHTADIVDVAPNVRVVHVEAGPPRTLDKYEVLEYLPEFACGVQRYRLLTGRRYDLIHAHYWLSMRTGQQFQERWQAPLVAQFHTLAQLKNRVARDDAEREHQVRYDIERAAIAQADRVVAVSATDRRQMETLYGACPRKIELVPGGVDLTRFRPGSRLAARAELGLPADAAILLFVGRIQRLKGIEVLIRAAAELQEQRRLNRELLVLIVGGRPGEGPKRSPEQREIARLQSLAAGLGLAGLVRFVGAVQQDRLPSYYRAAEVTVMPSSYESFGLVAVESLASGTPVVASQVGGLRSIVENGKDGYLIPWRHPHLFAEKLEQILSDPILAARLSAQGVRSAQRFSWGSAARRLIRLYEQLLAAERPMLEPARAGTLSTF
jgi:D-inositol-3-phosphate glycosyltransferase